MEDEIMALKKNGTWTLVPYSPSVNIVGNKWVFKVKHDMYGKFQRCKARLVAKGFLQTPGVDFNETFSPVIKASTIRMVLTIAVSRNWEVRQLDINNAFLNGDLQEVVYMHQPEGFIDKQKPDHVCRLNKALYGLKQAPRAWFDRLRLTLQSWGFKNSKCDSSFFFLVSNNQITLVLIYVDDIIVTGSNAVSLQSFVEKLHKLFSLKDMGALHLFLGIEVKRDEMGMYLTQTRYIDELLKRVGMENTKPCPTPAVIRKPLRATYGQPMKNPTLYRSTIGALQYTT